MKKQEIINARYNPDKLFENRIAQSTVVSTNEGTTAQPVSTQMIEYKESFIKRIWNGGSDITKCNCDNTLINIQGGGDQIRK